MSSDGNSKMGTLKKLIYCHRMGKDEKIMKTGIADLYIPHMTTFLACFRDVLLATGPK